MQRKRDSKADKPKWIKTSHANLYQNRDSGRYYARIQKNGKDKWQSLKTTNLSSAKYKLLDLRKHHMEAKAIASGDEAKITMGQMMSEREAEILRDVDIKPRTADYKIEIHEAICANWRGIKGRTIRSVTELQCKKFIDKMKAKYSSNRTNNIIRTLRDLFHRAKRRGIIFQNPMEEVKNAKTIRKKTQLPSAEQLEELAKEVEAGSWKGRQSER